MSRLRLENFSRALYIERARARALVIAAGTVLAAALICTPPARGRGESCRVAPASPSLSSRAAPGRD
jgi:hypothetical protein